MQRPPATSPELLSANFNQDFSCVAVGTRSGYAITNCEPFGRIYAKPLVEMLFCTSLVALVALPDANSSASPRRLQIVNTKSTICELEFPSMIVAVRMNRKRLVVVLDTEIYVYDISNMKLLHTIETGPNPGGVCALTPSSEPCLLTYSTHVPSPATGADDSAAAPGNVIVYDLLTLSVANVIQAHRTRIACLATSADGSLLATASDKGTVIRVYAIPSGRLLHQFRRGSYSARIHSLTFNAANTLLCVSSDSDTVHLFKLLREQPSHGSVAGDVDVALERKRRHGTLNDWREQSLALGRNVAGYLPTSLAEMWEPERDFAFLKLPHSGVSSVAAVSSTLPLVMVITSEGYFYTYALNLEHGGECVLTRQHALL